MNTYVITITDKLGNIHDVELQADNKYIAIAQATYESDIQSDIVECIATNH